MAAREYTNQHLYRALRLTIRTYLRSSGLAGKIGNATGFVLRPWDESHAGFLITNRHVLDPAFNGSDYVDYALDSVTIESYSPNNPANEPIVIELTSVNPVFISGRPDVDLGLIDLATHLPAGERLPYAFSIMDLVTPDDIRRDHIGVGSEIVMAGYPDLGGSVGSRPVLVAGRVSSDLRVPAAFGEKTYPDQGLCHAFSRGGMSGSPVLTAVEQGVDRDGKERGAQVQVLGVNAGHIQLGHGDSGVISLFVPTPALLMLLREVDDKAAALWSML